MSAFPEAQAALHCGNFLNGPVDFIVGRAVLHARPGAMPDR
jgi:hypothetical protein